MAMWQWSPVGRRKQKKQYSQRYSLFLCDMKVLDRDVEMRGVHSDPFDFVCSFRIH